MNMLKGLLCAALIPTIASAIIIDAPDWVTQVDSLLGNLNGIQAALAHDTVLYQNYYNQLTAMLSNFNTADLQRQRIILSVSNAIAALNNNLLVCRNDLTATQANLAICQANLLNQQAAHEAIVGGLEGRISALHGDIDFLQAHIATLQQQTQAEIDRLNAEIVSLQDELISTQQAYATLICLDETKAEELITEINEIQQRYQQMAAARFNLLATLDQFIGRTNQFVNDTNAQLQGLAAQVVPVATCQTNN